MEFEPYKIKKPEESDYLIAYIDLLGTKEYVEKFGTKEKATQEAAENVVKNLKDDCGRWLEQATKTKTGKVAMIAAGTAIAGALIGLALRPSKKEA